MYRYVAFSWQRGDGSAETEARKIIRRLHASQPEWTCALERIGLVVLHTDVHPGRMRAYTLHGNAGVVLGRLFPKDLPRNTAAEDADLDERASREIVRSGGSHLIEKHWGRYVAFINDEERDLNYVLRDPSGGIPCFFLNWRNVRVFFSHVKDIADLGFYTFSINWKYISAFLLHNHLQISDTGLQGVSELLTGERLAISNRDTVKEFLWNPTKIAENDVIDKIDRASELVENTAKLCIGAWGSTYHTIIHRLSGGLDSAVVLSCLNQSPNRPRILCENQFSSASPESDERAFARIVAARAKIPLIETEIRPELSRFDRLLDIPLTIKPSIALLSFPQQEVLRLKEQYAVDAYTTGQGGDQIFFRFRENIVAADYAWRQGFRAELLKIILDTANLTRRSVWSVLRTVISNGTLRRPYDGYALFLDPRSFLPQSAARELDRQYLMHPWLKETSRIPPGKMMHVFGVADLQYYHEPTIISCAIDAPIMFASQPLVELCLQIPTYVLTEGTVDRAVERTAFARDLPREILERESKGGTTRHFSRVLANNLSFIRELLLDGLLMREGLLDRLKLDRSLSQNHMIRFDGVESLLNCVAAESWLQRWSKSLTQVEN